MRNIKNTKKIRHLFVLYIESSENLLQMRKQSYILVEGIYRNQIEFRVYVMKEDKMNEWMTEEEQREVEALLLKKGWLVEIDGEYVLTEEAAKAIFGNAFRWGEEDDIQE